MDSLLILGSIISICFLQCAKLAPVINNLTPESTAQAPSAQQASSSIPSVQALQFMKRFGYLDPGIPDSDALYSEDAIIDAIKTVQKFGAIPQTGELDNRTIELMNSKRCGVADVSRDKNRRSKRYILGSEGWRKRKITYFLANWSPKIGEEAAAQEIQRAFDSWSGYARLKFEHIRDPSADILIVFGRGPHGDGYPFDGPGNILAHAFFPYEMGSYGGDVHFDDDEPWTTRPEDSETGIDFFTVAVHELGHSLGLSHSPVSSSIMFPYYKGYQPNFQLDYDDILAMYELYISRSLEGDKEIQTSDREEGDGQNEGGDSGERDREHDNDDNDNGSDAGDNDTDDDGDNDVGSDDDSVREDENDTSAQDEGTEDDKQDPKTPDDDEEEGKWHPTSPSPPPSTPTTSTDDVTFVGDDETVDDHIKHTTPWKPTAPSIPDVCNGNYDAVALLRSELFVFKNEFAWRLSDRSEVQEGYPVLFRHIFWKLPPTVTKIDCAYQRETDQNIVLFTGDTYWVFNGDDFVQSSRPLSDLGLPAYLSHVDACMVWGKNGKTFFFSGEQYWRFNETTREMDPGYPHSIKRWRGVPSHLDAALTWTDGLTYFFKDSLFWQFNNTIIKTEDNFPQDAPRYWLGCS